MKLFNKVAIIGVGLIGGSLALGIKKKRLARQVVGVSRHKKSLFLAKKIGAIDAGSRELDIIKGADLVILATPVNTIINLAPKISKIVRKGCIVSDVGSTKEDIAACLGKTFLNYVGGHTLAGSEKRSIINADPRIFKNSLCILTPMKNTQARALNKISLLWRQMGAKVILLSPKTHDTVLSFTSHLPHILAFSLIKSVPREFFKFASTGLRDTTRIATSDSELWRDIFLSNPKNILKAIKLFEHNLSRVKQAVQKKDGRRLLLILREAQKRRNSLN